MNNNTSEEKKILRIGEKSFFVYDSQEARQKMEMWLSDGRHESRWMSMHAIAEVLGERQCEEIKSIVKFIEWPVLLSGVVKLVPGMKEEYTMALSSREKSSEESVLNPETT